MRQKNLLKFSPTVPVFTYVFSLLHMYLLMFFYCVSCVLGFGCHLYCYKYLSAIMSWFEIIQSVCSLNTLFESSSSTGFILVLFYVDWRRLCETLKTYSDWRIFFFIVRNFCDLLDSEYWNFRHVSTTSFLLCDEYTGSGYIWFYSHGYPYNPYFYINHQYNNLETSQACTQVARYTGSSP